MTHYAKKFFENCDLETFDDFTSEERHSWWKQVNERRAGYLTSDSKGEASDWMDFMLPDFKEWFKEYSTSKNTNRGDHLLQRGRNSVLNDETKRFRKSIWLPFSNMVARAFETETPIEPADRMAAHEQLVLSLVGNDTPGVYVNISPDNEYLFKLGESYDVAERNKSHKCSGDLYLTRVYATTDKATALNLQNAIFDKLEERKNELVKRCRISGQRLSNSGPITFRDGFDPVEVIHQIVHNSYKRFCRATIGTGMF
jgi:hypothetical protein